MTAIRRVLPKRNRKLWFLFLSAAGSWANSILTATSLLLSRGKTANWLNTAPLWLANNWKNLPPEPGRIVPSRENKISCETRGCGFDFEKWQSSGVPADAASDHAAEMGVSRRQNRRRRTAAGRAAPRTR